MRSRSGLQACQAHVRRTFGHVRARSLDAVKRAPTLLALVLVFPPQMAVADDADADGLFSEARALMEQSRFAEACPKLEESQRIAPLLQKRAFLGVCHEREGKTATAWRDYLAVADVAGQAGLDNRQAKAKALAEALEPKLRKIRIALTEPTVGEAITIDGETPPTALLDGAIPLDPGAHHIEAHAPARVPWSMDLTLDEDGKEVPVPVPSLENEPVAPQVNAIAPQAPVVTHPAVLAPRATPTSPTRFRDYMIAGGTTAGASAAALVVGTYFGLHAFAQKHDSDLNCGTFGCLPAAVDFMNGARTSSYISTAAFVIGLAGAATSTVFFVWGAKRQQLATVAVTASGLRLGGRW